MCRQVRIHTRQFCTRGASSNYSQMASLVELGCVVVGRGRGGRVVQNAPRIRHLAQSALSNCIMCFTTSEIMVLISEDTSDKDLCIRVVNSTRK